jgi:hypothetical protein
MRRALSKSSSLFFPRVLLGLRQTLLKTGSFSLSGVVRRGGRRLKTLFRKLLLILIPLRLCLLRPTFGILKLDLAIASWIISFSRREKLLLVTRICRLFPFRFVADLLVLLEMGGFPGINAGRIGFIQLIL